MTSFYHSYFLSVFFRSQTPIPAAGISPMRAKTSAPVAGVIFALFGFSTGSPPFVCGLVGEGVGCTLLGVGVFVFSGSQAYSPPPKIGIQVGVATGISVCASTRAVVPCKE